jgi:ubiquinone/menaquinone biosynthesis C-methylase UbiE
MCSSLPINERRYRVVMAKAPHTMFARFYDLFMVPQDRFGLRHQRAKLCGDATGRVLEIAIGTGLNIPHYNGADSVVGVDNDRGMLRRAIRRTWESPVPVELVAADARNLPFPDASFDSVVIGFSLCTIPNPETALEEFARVTAPGGTFHFLEHVRSGKPRTARLQDRYSGIWERVSGGCRANQDTGALLEQSSWSISNVWTSESGGLIQGSASKS